jgi:hypothetical protein
MFSLKILDLIGSVVMPLFVLLDKFTTRSELLSHVHKLFVGIYQGIFIFQLFFLQLLSLFSLLFQFLLVLPLGSQLLSFFFLEVLAA